MAHAAALLPYAEGDPHDHSPCIGRAANGLPLHSLPEAGAKALAGAADINEDSLHALVALKN